MRRGDEPRRDVVLRERVQADEAAPTARRHVGGDAGDQEPLRRPEHVVLGEAVGAPQAAQERDLRVGDELLDRVRDVRAAPGVAARLLVVLPERAAVADSADAVVADRQQDRLHFGLAAELEEALQEHVPVFRHHVHVPVADVVAHTHAEAVRRLREQDGVLPDELGEVVDAAEAVLDAQRRGNVPDVVVVEDRALPERTVAPRVDGEVVRERAEVARVEERVGVAARHGHVVEVEAHLVAEEPLRLFGGPRFVRRLAAHLARDVLRVRRADHREEAVPELASQDVEPLRRAGVRLLHRDDHEQLVERNLALGELAERGAELLDGLLVRRDDDQVMDIVPIDDVAIEGRALDVVAAPPVDARRRLHRPVALEGVEAHVDRAPRPVEVEAEQHDDERDRQEVRAPDERRNQGEGQREGQHLETARGQALPRRDVYAPFDRGRDFRDRLRDAAEVDRSRRSHHGDLRWLLPRPDERRRAAPAAAERLGHVDESRRRHGLPDSAKAAGGLRSLSCRFDGG